MNEIFELLDRKERSILGVLCLFLVLALLFLFVVALGEKRTFSGSLDRLASTKESAQEMEILRRAKNAEWLKWQKTLSDIEELKEKRFYRKEEGIAPLMRDTRRILNSTRIRVSQKKYDYANLKEGTYRVVKITFEITGSYTALKKFIHSVESFSRFLMVQRIDFLDVDPISGGLRVRMTLAGYYEE
jgi:Tfp pilus assembly protein PilO